MSVKEVPSDHDFFDPAYVKHWTESISRYRPERKRLFEVFAAEAARIKKGALSVFELGCGPGFLAEALLKNCEIARYTLVDFSPQMLDLSRSRLAKFQDRTVFIRADFKKANWAAGIRAGFDLIVSLQAVHELRHASRIPNLYAQLHSLLLPGRTILICDHVNSSSPSGQRAAHFMTVEEHLSTFKKVGFINAREICPAADLSLMAAEKKVAAVSVVNGRSLAGLAAEVRLPPEPGFPVSEIVLISRSDAESILQHPPSPSGIEAVAANFENVTTYGN